MSATQNFRAVVETQLETRGFDWALLALVASAFLFLVAGNMFADFAIVLLSAVPALEGVALVTDWRGTAQGLAKRWWTPVSPVVFRFWGLLFLVMALVTAGDGLSHLLNG